MKNELVHQFGKDKGIQMPKSITDKTIVLFKYNGTPLVANAITVSNTPFVKPNIKTQTYKDVGYRD